MELSEIRKKIDEIDAKLLPLFVERMQCAEQVAQTKKERGLPIFNAQREQEILDKVALSTPDFDCEAKMLYTVMMALSRARQHKLLHSGASVREEIERALQASPSPSVPKVACPGVFGSFSHEAAKSLLPNGEVQFYTGFPDIFQAIETGGCRFGVVPVENSSAGSVAEVYDLLLHYRFHIVGAAVLQIRHCLAAPQGASLASVRKVYSHPQALAQCSQLLHSQGWDGVQHSNTAAAAKMVAQAGDPSQAAICSTPGGQRIRAANPAGKHPEQRPQPHAVCRDRKGNAHPGGRAENQPVLFPAPHDRLAVQRAGALCHERAEPDKNRIPPHRARHRRGNIRVRFLSRLYRPGSGSAHAGSHL